MNYPSVTEGAIFGGGFRSLSAVPLGINDLGAFVGYEIASNAGFVSNGGWTVLPGPANDINNSGQVVGADGSNAYLYSNGTLTVLGSGAARAINDNGEIVDRNPNSSSSAAFLYRNGNWTNLNTLIDPASGWALRDAYGINNIGQIVGYGTLNGQYRAFLLTPVPEPSIIVLLAIGSIGVLAYALRRRR